MCVISNPIGMDAADLADKVTPARRDQLLNTEQFPRLRALRDKLAWLRCTCEGRTTGCRSKWALVWHETRHVTHAFSAFCVNVDELN